MPFAAHDQYSEASPHGSARIPTTGLVLYEGTDQQRIREQVSAHFAPHPMRLGRGGELAAEFRLVHRGDVDLYVLRYGCPAEIRFNTSDFYCVYLTHTGGGQLAVNDRTMAFSPSITGPDDRVVQSWASDTVALIARISRRVIDDAVAKQVGVRPSSPVRFVPVIDQAAPLSRNWLALARDFSEAAAVGMLRRSHLIQTHFERMLVHGLLSGQPHSCSRQMTRSPAMPAPLRRAVAYCEEHVREDPTVADIADAAQTSIRRLQELFRTHLQTTPLGFVRRLRLARAHSELIALGEGDHRGKVTEIAARWGFAHQGRFAEQYREVYGALPSQTARSGPSAARPDESR